MDKKQYIAPAISVMAMEVQQIIAASPEKNKIYDDMIVIDPDDEETINGEDCF